MPMDKVRNYHQDVAPTLGNYVRSIKVGSMLFVAGCTAVGTPAEDGDVVSQADATLNRIKQVVEAEGAAMSDIVKVTIYVTDMDGFRPRMAEFDLLMEKYFQGEYPTSTLVASPGLARPSLLIEIEPTVVL